MAILFVLLWIYNKLKENVHALNIFHVRKKWMKVKHKENHIKRLQVGEMIFSCLLAAEFTQCVPYPLIIFRWQKSIQIHTKWVNVHILMFIYIRGSLSFHGRILRSCVSEKTMKWILGATLSLGLCGTFGG